VRVVAVAIAVLAIAPPVSGAPTLDPPKPTLAAYVASTVTTRGAHAETVAPPRGGAALEPIGDEAAWLCIHNGTPVAGGEPGTDGQGEGPWNDAGDPYWGGLQMDRGFMSAYGSDFIREHRGEGAGGLGLADSWTPREQMVAAERARSSGRGYYPWPLTARRCGLIAA
jgi:hypothetical protein